MSERDINFYANMWHFSNYQEVYAEVDNTREVTDILSGQMFRLTQALEADFPDLEALAGGQEAMFMIYLGFTRPRDKELNPVADTIQFTAGQYFVRQLVNQSRQVTEEKLLELDVMPDFSEPETTAIIEDTCSDLEASSTLFSLELSHGTHPQLRRTQLIEAYRDLVAQALDSYTVIPTVIEEELFATLNQALHLAKAKAISALLTQRGILFPEDTEKWATKILEDDSSPLIANLKLLTRLLSPTK